MSTLDRYVSYLLALEASGDERAIVKAQREATAYAGWAYRQAVGSSDPRRDLREAFASRAPASVSSERIVAALSARI